jgi:OFA family oxalate/formate antiporter-like MFS transporter
MKRENRWVYVVLGAAILLFAGVIYAWSVVSGPIAAEFSYWSKASLSLTFTIAMICFCLGSLGAGFLTPKTSSRANLWVSALLFLAGFFISSRTQSLTGLYLGFGVLAGLGSGISYNIVVSGVTKWYPEKQGLVSGILLMGFGIGSFLIGKVFQACTPDAVGAWRTSFVYIGAVTAAVIFVCGTFLKRPEAEAGRDKDAGSKNGRDYKTGEMLKTPSFWLFYFWAIVLTAAGLAVISQASGIVREISPSVSGGAMATIVGLISVFNGAGRIVFGGMFDRLGRARTMMTVNLLFVLTAGVLLLTLKTHSTALLTAGFIITGLAYSGIPPTNSAFISRYYGQKNFPLNYPVVNTNMLFSSFGSAIAGSLYDGSGTYVSTFLMIAVCAVLGILSALGISAADRRGKQS